MIDSLVISKIKQVKRKFAPLLTTFDIVALNGLESLFSCQIVQILFDDSATTLV